MTVDSEKELQALKAIERVCVETIVVTKNEPIILTTPATLIHKLFFDRTISEI